MPIFQLAEEILAFPHPSLASEEGILAVGGDLSPERLMLAYEYGIFPWYNEGEPILWWSPDPRFVLFPKELRVAKSMRSYFNRQIYRVTLDQRFREVMEKCRLIRRQRQEGETWIHPEMVDAYHRLHELGLAHSVEVWEGEALVGGLYGVSLGKIFFGESMFSDRSNASKFGFIWLVKRLESLGFWLIDCQVYTSHLESLGARAIPRDDFQGLLAQNRSEQNLAGNWSALLGS